jgi:hypothetical protein
MLIKTQSELMAYSRMCAVNVPEIPLIATVTKQGVKRTVTLYTNTIVMLKTYTLKTELCEICRNITT